MMVDRKRLAVMVDLDGTLCDTRHRDHLLPDWEAHSLACSDDPPVPANIELVNWLSINHSIIICSGRRDLARERTEGWLDNHNVEWDHLLLRAEGDFRNNAEYKIARVKEMEAEGYNFVLGVEDYWKSATALSEYGIPTILVTSFTTHGNPEELLGLMGEAK